MLTGFGAAAYNAAMRISIPAEKQAQSEHSTLSTPPEQSDRGELLRRISVVTWAVVATMAASLFLRLPTVVISLSALGSPITLAVGDATLMAFFIATLAASGSESVIRLHPSMQEQARSGQALRTWPDRALPAALAILAVLLVPLAPSRIFQISAVALGGLLVTLALFGLYSTVDAKSPGFRRSRILLNLLAYGAALVLFLLVYQMRTRSLLSGTLVAATAALLAAELLRTTTPRAVRVLSHAAIVGLVLGEATWALNYWSLPGVTGGLLLLLVFYLIVGVAQQGLQEHLTRRVLVEFALFALLALILIAVVGPGF